jgi:hypothetical protein
MVLGSAGHSGTRDEPEEGLERLTRASRGRKDVGWLRSESAGRSPWGLGHTWELAGCAGSTPAAPRAPSEREALEMESLGIRPKEPGSRVFTSLSLTGVCA